MNIFEDQNVETEMIKDAEGTFSLHGDHGDLDHVLGELGIVDLGADVRAEIGEEIGIAVGADEPSDYEKGEAQVLELVKAFDQMNRPKSIEPQVMELYGRFEKARSSNFVTRAYNAPTMKALGEEAARLLAEVKKVYARQTATNLADLPPPPPAAPFLSQRHFGLPVYAWGIIGVAALTLTGYGVYRARRRG